MQCGLWRWIKELTVHEYDDVQPVQSAGTVVLLEALRASEDNKGAGTVADGLLILIHPAISAAAIQPPFKLPRQAAGCQFKPNGLTRPSCRVNSA